MITAAVTLAFVAPPYTSTLIYKFDEDWSGRSRIACTVMTDNLTIAGWACDSLGHHSETFASKPFVWSKGRSHQLPLLPHGRYGKVLDGNDKMLIGSADVNYRHCPVMWTPHPKYGWSRAKVTNLGPAKGQAIVLQSDGTIWIEHELDVVARGKPGHWDPISFGKFNMKGVDARGNRYGNMYKGIYMGGRPADIQTGFFTDRTWTKLPMGRPENGSFLDSKLAAVNSSGTAVGTTENTLAIWTKGKLSRPLHGKHRWSFGHAISESGLVLGRASVPDVDKEMVFLWANGKQIDLTFTIPGVPLDSPGRFNPRGDMTVSGVFKTERRLYLLQSR